jgi:hypothetical protein
VIRVDRGGALQDAGHRIAGEVALGAAGIAADQAHRFEFLQQFVLAAWHVQHAVVAVAVRGAGPHQA